MDNMVKVAYVTYNTPHIGHLIWIAILRKIMKTRIMRYAELPLKPPLNEIIITEGARPTAISIPFKYVNKCIVSIALSPSITNPRINKIYSITDMVIAVSNMVKQLINAKRTAVIYPRPPELEQLVKLRVDNKKPWICYSGILAPIKGVHILPEVMNRIIKEINNARMILIGGGSPSIVTRKSKELSDYIIITGPQPRSAVFNILRNCAVYVQPSLFDAFSISVVEAMALENVPVVAKNVGSKDLVEKLDKSLVVSYDSEEMAQAIINAMNSKELGKEARELVAQELSIEREAERLIEVLNECL